MSGHPANLVRCWRDLRSALQPAPVLWMLLPAVMAIPLLGLTLAGVHGGGLSLVRRFLLAALSPSLEPALLHGLLQGLGTTLALALLSWFASVLLGLCCGLLSAECIWQEICGRRWPAWLWRRLLALPRSLHELVWGLLLLQLYGLHPMVAVVAITIPYGALVARVVADQLDSLPTAPLAALRQAGTPALPALLTALGPALLPGLCSYAAYRLECALRSAALLGVFGLGGIGTDLRLSLQSLAFNELWTGLWLLGLTMVALERCSASLRRRWSAGTRLSGAAVPVEQGSVGQQGRECLLFLLALLPLLGLAAGSLQLEPLGLLHVRPLPLPSVWNWESALALPWLQLVSTTLLLSLAAAGLAIGMAPLCLLLQRQCQLPVWLIQTVWLLLRLWPPPLIALLLLLVSLPGPWIAALAIGLHNLGVLGRLLLDQLDHESCLPEQMLLATGVSPGLALFYGGFDSVAPAYLAYGAYRADVMLRESVVVGLVGGAGLGTVLLESLSSFAWEDLLAVLAAYLLLTLTGEALSDGLRHRLLFTD